MPGRNHHSSTSVEPLGLMGPMSGPFRGAGGFRAGWPEWLAPFDRYAIELERLAEAPEGRVIALARSLASLPGSTTEIPGAAAVVFTVRGGLIAAVDHYLDHEQALRDAGLDPDA